MTAHLWLRSEEKPGECRMALTPSVAGKLLQQGVQVTVEESVSGCFPSADFAAVGCRIEPAGSWQQSSHDTIILGLKELTENTTPLHHRHIHFAHVYKHQAGWRSVLQRFANGGGQLFDLEFLVDDQQRRVAAFGYWAGYAGAAVALMGWAGQQQRATPVLESITPYSDRTELMRAVKKRIDPLARQPRVLVMGAKGRCGSGACECAEAAGAEVIAWDIEQTRQGGPFEEILQADIFINCVFVQSAIEPFVTRELLAGPRELTLVCDVSCDPFGDYNPVPIYSGITSFTDPVLRIIDAVPGQTPPLDVISIDHLPSMLPRESSDDFVGQLAPHLLELCLQSGDRTAADYGGVWRRALDVFEQKLSELQ